MTIDISVLDQPSCGMRDWSMCSMGKRANAGFAAKAVLGCFTLCRYFYVFFLNKMQKMLFHYIAVGWIISIL